MEKQTRAYLYACAAVLFWATSASAFKISLGYIDIFSLLFFASVTSSVALLIYIFISKRLVLLKGLNKKDYLYSFLLGFLNPFLYYAIVFKAYSILPAQEAQPLNFIWPITLVLLSIPLLRQKIKSKDILATFICFVGVFVISTRGDIFGFKFTNITGVLLATGSSVVWALFWIYNVRDRRDEVIRLFLNFVFGSFLTFLLMLIVGDMHNLNLSGMFGGIYIGLFEMGITFLLWLRALKLSKTTAHVTNLIYFVPFLSLVIIRLTVGEAILPSTIVGLIFIIGGIILQKL